MDATTAAIERPLDEFSVGAQGPVWQTADKLPGFSEE